MTTTQPFLPFHIDRVHGPLRPHWQVHCIRKSTMSAPTTPHRVCHIHRVQHVHRVRINVQHVDRAHRAHPAYSAVDERRPVRVPRCMDGYSARLGPRHRDARLSLGTSSRRRGPIVMVTEVLDRVERNKPSYILPKTHQNKLRKQIGDLPKPERCQSKLPDSSGYR